MAEGWFESFAQLAAGHDRGTIGFVFRMNFYGRMPEEFITSASRSGPSRFESRLDELSSVSTAANASAAATPG
jgi:hypothetical protein